MRFYPGILFGGRRPRGRGRRDPPYRLSRAAYQARLRNITRVKRLRSYDETRRLEIEIALAVHRGLGKRQGETYRALARRLGLRSHAHCWRVARRYRLGLLPLLPRDEPRLVKLRDSLYGEAPPDDVTPGRYIQREPPDAMTTDDIIAEARREADEWKRNHLFRRRPVAFRVRVP